MKTKKNVIWCVVLFLMIGFTANAQNFQGHAVYEVKYKIDFDFAGRKIPEEHKQRILKRLKEASLQTFVLDFNRFSSLYKKEEKLESPSNDNGRRGRGMTMMMGGSGVSYTNVATKETVQEKEFFGKKFLIKEALTPLKWTLVDETRKIGNHICYKATTTITMNKKVFEKQGEKGNDEVLVTAWYTPQVPVSLGPENYFGLPGLILGASSDKFQIFCSKLVLNPKEGAEIKAPKKGKKVTQEEFDEIVVKKTKEMRERFKNRRPRGPRR